MNHDRSAHRRVLRAGALCAILACSVVLQGCLAAAWVVAVGGDSLRTSDVSFRPFEQSWVSQPKEDLDEADALLLTSVALLPVEGDAEMGSRLAQVLQQQTALRVESTAKLEREISAPETDDDRATIAKELTRELVVDAVLFGRVSGAPAHPSDWGWTREESRRLFLYLVDHEGRLLWKDELPFTVVIGSKPPIEHSVQTSLAHHLMDHVRDLGLDGLGYLPKKTS
ncbi:MAG TPA: hypothetical protein VKP13_18250 [Nitrospira sp.]|nr:hypothetical protein [Nitrospira sp.]